MNISKGLILFSIIIFLYSCQNNKLNKPNVLFIMMDDLGYGQFGIYNDTINTEDFNPWFVHLVDSLQGYSLEQSLEFSKTAIPTLTSLAKSAIIFTNAHTSSNLCSPSRLGIATGTLQNKWGVYRNTDSEELGIVPGTHLAEKLKDLSYKTAHIGKWHVGKRDNNIIRKAREKLAASGSENFGDVEVNRLAEKLGYSGSVIEEHNPLNNGFDYYFGYNHWASQFYNSTLVWENFEHAGKQEGYNTDVFTDKAIGFMEKQIDVGNKFYVQLHYHAVHDSLEPRAPDKYFNKFDSDSYDLNNFYAHVYGVDFNVKRIVDFLKEKGQFENTIIVFTSDNGAMCGGKYNGNKTGSPLPGNTPFSGHKGTYYQGGMRVPMFVHWPVGIKTPAVLNQLISTMDILPTAIEAGGGKVPEDINGKSLLSLIQNPDDTEIHDHLIWAGIHSATWGYLITKTTKTHDTERPFAPPAWVVRKGDYLLRFVGKVDPGIYLDFPEGDGGRIELYNVIKDPAEFINLAQSMPEKVNELAHIYFNESIEFKPPAEWPKEKWEELVNSKDLLNDLH